MEEKLNVESAKGSVGESIHSKANLKRFLPNILFAVLSTLCNSLFYVTNRMLRGHEGVSVPFQLIFTFAGLIVLGIYRIKILPENKRAHFNFETVKFVLLRCSTNIFGLILVNLTCRYLDVDTATAIIFMSPLFSSLLSVTFFETKFTSEDVKVFAICLIGVVFACQPFKKIALEGMRADHDVAILDCLDPRH